MTDKTPKSSRLARYASLGAFCALLVALPLAVEFDVAPHRFLHATLQAKLRNAVVVLTPVKLSQDLALTLDAGLVSIDGSAPSSRRIVVDEARLTLDFARSGRTAEKPSARLGLEVDPPAIASIDGFKAGAMHLRRGTLALVGSSGRRHFITDVEATVSSQRLGNYKVAGTGNFNGQKLTLDGSWTIPTSSGAAQPVRLALSLSSPSLTAKFDGELDASTAGIGDGPTLKGEAELAVPSVHRLAAWWGLGPSFDADVGGVRISGPVTWDAHRMAFAKASLRLGSSTATGALTFKGAEQRLAIDATLAFDALDLRQALGFGKREPDATVKVAASSHLLSLLDADLRLSASKFMLPGAETGRGAITVSLNQGKLGANLVDLDLEGGKADGRLTIDVNHHTPRASMKLKAHQIEVGRFFAASLPRNPLVGRTNLVFEGTAEGATVAESLTKLSGHGEMVLADEGRLGLDIMALMSSAKAKKVVGWAGAGNGGTSLDKLSCRFRIINGAVTLEAMQGRTGRTAVFGAGRLDIPGRLMDISLATGPVATGEVPTTAQSVITLRGTWDNPGISLAQPAEPQLRAVGLSPPAH